jgi:hypothetical protein
MGTPFQRTTNLVMIFSWTIQESGANE